MIAKAPEFLENSGAFYSQTSEVFDQTPRFKVHQKKLPKSFCTYRAVGRANATNPMPLVIPCHRAIGADGKLHSYGGGVGLKTKEWLLKMESGEI